MTSGVKFLGVPQSIDDEASQTNDQNELLLYEEFQQDIDEYKPETKSRNFEFTDNITIMRLLRVFIFLQFIAIILDNDAIRTPLLFQIFCTHGFIYILRFYSKPFCDICRLIQIFVEVLKKYFNVLISLISHGEHKRRLTKYVNILYIFI